MDKALRFIPFRFIVILLVALPALAECADSPEAAKPDPAGLLTKERAHLRPSKISTTDIGNAAASEPGMPKRVVERRVRQITKLRLAMYENLNLTDAQKTEISKIFEEYIRDIRSDTRTVRAVRMQTADPDPLKKLNALQAELKVAKMENNSADVARLEREIEQERFRLRPSALDPPRHLYGKLEEKISDGQKEPFRKLLHRWKVVHLRRAQLNMLRRLMRAIRDPSLTIDPEKRSRLQGLIAAELKALGPIGQTDKAKVESAYKELKDKIFKELTGAQRSWVEGTMKELNEDHKADEQFPPGAKRSAGP